MESKHPSNHKGTKYPGRKIILLNVEKFCENVQQSHLSESAGEEGAFSMDTTEPCEDRRGGVWFQL